MNIDGIRGFTLWRLVRPESWFQYLGLVVLRWSFRPGEPLPVLPLVWAALYLATGFAFNSACDAASDEPSKNPLTEAAEAVRLWQAGSGAALLLCAPAAIWMVPHHPWIAASQPVAGFLYSLPKAGLKRFPYAGTLSNIWLFVPLFWGGYAGELGETAFVFLLLAVPMLQSQLIHELVDTDEDARSSTGSTAARLGPVGVRRAVGVLHVLVIVAGASGAATGLVPLLPGLAMTAAAAAAYGFGSGDPAASRAFLRRAYSAACLFWLGFNLWRQFR